MVDRGGEVGFVEEDARLGVVQDGGELGRGEPHVDRHRDRAGEEGGVIAFEELVVIEAEVRDAVAGLDAERLEPEGEALAPFAELGVGEAEVAGDDGGLPRVEVDAAIEAANRAQWHAHALRVYSGRAEVFKPERRRVAWACGSLQPQRRGARRGSAEETARGERKRKQRAHWAGALWLVRQVARATAQVNS